MSTLDSFPPISPDIISWSDLIAQPWLNGGGVTREVLSQRLTASGEWVAAGADDWDWRLSIADVDTAGAFSNFTEMTRTLTVIEGDSITLTVDGVDEELEKLRPFTFDGGATTSALLPNGPIRDLNLIVRTGRVSANVRIDSLTSDRPFSVTDGQFCILLAGQALLRRSDAATIDAAGVELHRFDTVVGVPDLPLTIKGDGTLAVVDVGAHAGVAVLEPAKRWS